MLLRNSFSRQNPHHQKPLINHILQTLKLCKSSRQVQQTHTQILINSISMPMPNYLLTQIITLKDFTYSSLLFPQIPINSYAFNVMIRGLSTTWQRFDLSLKFFIKMKSLYLKPDNFTYPFVFIAIGNVSDVGLGRLVHCEVLKSGLLVDFHVVHSLITMYSRCWEMGSARGVFDEMSVRDEVSWNSVISGYQKMGMAGEAVRMFGEMRREGFEPDETTIVSVLGACGDLGDLELGRWIEGYVMEKRMGINSYIGSALVSMFGKCGELGSARSLFDSMRRKEIVTWNAMITG